MQPLSPRSASLEPPLRGALLVTLTVISVLLTGLASAQQVTVAAVGDIACSPDGNPNASGGKGDETRCQMLATSELVAEHGVQAVLALGDLQYASSSRQLAAFRASYDLSWGRFKDITYPVPGNHEYDTPDAEGYYKYFGDRAGDPERGYDSFDLGEWHIVALNSNCEEGGRLRRGVGAVPLARVRRGGSPVGLPSRLLAPPALQLWKARLTHGLPGVLEHPPACGRRRRSRGP